MAVLLSPRASSRTSSRGRSCGRTSFSTRCARGTCPRSLKRPGEAVWLVARGFFKKLVVADRIGATVDPFFAHVNDPTTAGVWALPYVWLYALQIYFDFSAYTDMARGIGLLFGYRWPEKLRPPVPRRERHGLLAAWHMTLSRFLRDYLYISLGGNRHGHDPHLLEPHAHDGARRVVARGELGVSRVGALHGGFLIAHRVWSGTALASWLNSREGGALRVARRLGAADVPLRLPGVVLLPAHAVRGQRRVRAEVGGVRPGEDVERAVDRPGRVARRPVLRGGSRGQRNRCARRRRRKTAAVRRGCGVGRAVRDTPPSRRYWPRSARPPRSSTSSSESSSRPRSRPPCAVASPLVKATAHGCAYSLHATSRRPMRAVAIAFSSATILVRSAPPVPPMRATGIPSSSGGRSANRTSTVPSS